MALIVDASMAASWVLPDEQNAEANKVLLHLTKTKGHVPDLFWYEMRNLCALAEKRNRIKTGEALIALIRLRQLPLDDQSVNNDHAIISLTFKHALSAYDASYLALAINQNLPLATLDRRLATAARAENVEILGPLGNLF